jgi:S1-C subfamily serine protease
MKRLLGAMLLLLSATAFCADFSIIRSYSRVVLISAPIDDKSSVVRGSGSAITLTEGYALTAAHNIPTDPNLKASLGQGVRIVDIKVIKIDRDVDLALVSAPEIKCPCAPLATHVEQDEDAWIVGFPKFLSHRTQFVTVGTIQGMLGGRVVATPTSAPGSSGGGLFVKHDGTYQLAGMLVAIHGTPIGPRELGLDQETQWITFSVSAAAIKTFLKGTPLEMK